MKRHPALTTHTRNDKNSGFDNFLLLQESMKVSPLQLNDLERREAAQEEVICEIKSNSNQMKSRGGDLLMQRSLDLRWM